MNFQFKEQVGFFSKSFSLLFVSLSLLVTFFSFLKQLLSLFKNGKTALHCAAFKGFKEIVEILIEHGSNVNLQANFLVFFYGQTKNSQNLGV